MSTIQIKDVPPQFMQRIRIVAATSGTTIRNFLIRAIEEALKKVKT